MGSDVASGAGEIAVLPALVVDQIAAGEVVERPASVVKELIDNAIDAGATRIAVELEGGGTELVRVTDDGRGVAPEQAELMLHPHATSKIRATADLDRIGTMGFRGEALASIASVSRLSVRSRPRGAEGAWIMEREAGGSGGPRPASGPVGTSVGVRTLFYNTPARRKFLRTPATEQGHCAEVVRALALSHPAIAFTLTADGRTLLELPGTPSARERAFGVIGREFDGQYVEVGADEIDTTGELTLWGLAGLPGLARPTARAQRLFLNGRPVRDKTVQHALREAYRGLIEPGRHPAALLMLAVDPGAVDVNVHPAKAEVRFRDSGRVHKAVYLGVREALRRADLTPDLAAGGAGGAGGAGSPGLRFEPATPGAGGASPDGAGRRLAAALRDFEPKAQGVGIDIAPIREAIEAERAELARERAAVDETRRRLVEAGPELRGDHLRASDRPDLPGQGAMAAPTPRGRVLQVHNSFLVTQDERGVVIIDQHALHERVMFERLTERVAGGDLESQALLMPEVVETTSARAELVEGLGALFRRLGMDVRPAGPTSVAVSAFPSFLGEKGVEPGPMVGEILERAEAEGWAGPEHTGARAEEVLREVLDMMACKAAVKAGDSLSDRELEELVEARERAERASNCPHGRPTAIRLTIRELERQFGRA